MVYFLSITSVQYKLTFVVNASNEVGPSNDAVRTGNSNNIEYFNEMVTIAPSGATILTTCVPLSAVLLAFLNVSTWHLLVRLQMPSARTMLESMVVSIVVKVSARKLFTVTLCTHSTDGLNGLRPFLTLAVSNLYIDATFVTNIVSVMLDMPC